MHQVKLRRIAWCASISDHTTERPAYLLLPFISKIKNSQVRAAGLAGAKALAEATVRARKAAVNFMVAWRWVVGCDGLMEWSEVRGREPVVNSALATTYEHFPLFFHFRDSPTK